MVIASVGGGGEGFLRGLDSGGGRMGGEMVVVVVVG